MPSDNPSFKVFISYSWDSDDHKKRVRSLADRLRGNGIDCEIDQYYESEPPPRWDKWMSDRIDEAKFTLLVCTEKYYKRFSGDEETGKGLGVTWEGAIITEQLYSSQGKNTNFIPILFFYEHQNYIPRGLRTASFYVLDDDAGYEQLYRRLTNQPRVQKPPVGKFWRLSENNYSKQNSSPNNPSKTSLTRQLSVVKESEMLRRAKKLELALWHLNHTKQVRLFESVAAKSENVVCCFRIQTSDDKRIPLVWLLKCLLKPSEDNNVIFALFELNAWSYGTNEFDKLLRGIFNALHLPGDFPDRESVQEVARKISKKIQQDNQHIALLFFHVDNKPKAYLNKLKEFCQHLIQEIQSDKTERRLLMCWIDYQSNQNDWRNVYKFYDKPSSKNNASKMFNLTLTEKVNKENDLKTWLRSQQSAVIAEVNSNLVEDEQIERTLEMIWKDSKDGEPKALLQAIYKLCKVSWINDESKWQNFY